MSITLLRTKLNIPPRRSEVVPRRRLVEQLDQGLHADHRLTLISAPAGFGKTTLVAEWIGHCERAAAWLSLDEGDGDLTRFLAYLIAALQTIAPDMGEIASGLLQSPQPPPAELVLTSLLNELASLPDEFLLVLDDYHTVEAPAVDQALAFMLEHQPAQMHLVVATREDPRLPLARLRARGQMTEVRAGKMRFTLEEAAEFLNQVMGLSLAPEEIAALERRTEGWVAGLQLAAISMRGQKDAAGFIDAFSGSHRFVLDYLMEEVLEQQPESVRSFLLQTSILDRLCGPLCDVVVGKSESGNGSQETLAYLERANLFLIALDNERRWYRYHHLFADLLRQRLGQQQEEEGVAELHRRASAWFEENCLDIEAFQHAVAANDVARAERLVQGKGMPLHFQGAVGPVLKWLASLPTAVLDARPSLWVTYASALTMVGHSVSAIEEKLRAAETAMAGPPDMAGPSGMAGADEKTRDLVGQIAAIRAMLAVPQNQVETMIAQARRALAFLHPDNLPVRTAATWSLGHAYQLQGNRAAARQAYSEIMSASQASGNIIFDIAATTGLGQIQESENDLYAAAETYQRVLQVAGEPPLAVACAAYLGLARIFYEWNDLDAAQEHGQQGLELARLLENNDAPAISWVLLARLDVARGDASGAADTLAEAEQFVRQNQFAHRMPDVAAAQVLVLLRQGDVPGAAELAQRHDPPLSRARVHLAQGEPRAAMALLEPEGRRAEAKDWQDERLKVLVLEALAHQARGDTERAVQRLGQALAMAEAGGFVRTFVDEGRPMARLLAEAARRGIRPAYAGELLAAFEAVKKPSLPAAQPLVEPLSPRELEILQLLAQGLSNRQIGERLFIALNTVKGHNRRIYGKLQVQRRTEAVARARELGLL